MLFDEYCTLSDNQQMMQFSQNWLFTENQSFLIKRRLIRILKDWRKIKKLLAVPIPQCCLGIYKFIQFQQINFINKMRRSYTEETRDQIVKNVLNDSTSKTSWSFSKDARFKLQKHTCPHIAYNVNLSTHSKRRASFGYGKRMSFVLENRFTPAPMTYSTQIHKLRKSTGCSFGVNREQATSSSYIPLGKLKNPGPGEYNHSTDRIDKRGYTMRPRTAYQRTYFIQNKELKQRPGPGKYEINGTLVELQNNNVLSKFKHLGVPNFQSRKSKRFAYGNQNPGPGTYKNFPNDGELIKSRNKSIGRQTRRSFTEIAAKGSFTPGPGSYKLPTDFGHY